MDIKQYVDTCAENICEYIRDTKVLDMGELKSMIKICISYDFVKVLDDERQTLREIRARIIEEMKSSPRSQQPMFEAKLAKIKRKDVKLAHVRTEMQAEARYTSLKQFVRERYGERVLQEYYKTQE